MNGVSRRASGKDNLLKAVEMLKRVIDRKECAFPDAMRPSYHRRKGVLI
jgi:hypothetical protein